MNLARGDSRIFRSFLHWSATCCVLLSGCSDPSTALVTGSVTVDGEPAQIGAISFLPADNQGTPVGASIEDGEYTAQVPFGLKKVEVRVSKEMGKKKMYDTPDSEVKVIRREALPPKYNSQTELTFDVKPGENRQDYHLKTE
ncbi:hypothetical protein [Bythopirellula polymerisocia]|nr:hypothetical protein [Bythopirellula polymerisocia]